MSLIKKICSGKNNKLIYFTRNLCFYMIPDFFYRRKLQKQLNEFNRTITSDLSNRFKYYIKLSNKFVLEKDSKILLDHKYSRRDYASVYFFDSFEYTRYFDKKFKWNYIFGDVTIIPSSPAFVKSRPISNDNENSVLLKLDKVRHFIFVKDKIIFEDKINKILFRGKIKNKYDRVFFMKNHFDNPLVDGGDIEYFGENPKVWKKDKKTIKEHLSYKFIMAIEGNDVASNLKWIMSSNSIAVMPKPKFETWFMEGTLIPNYHYILVKDDFSDLDERVHYYIEHIDEAKDIIKNANKYVEQFKNKKNEKLLSLAVMNKYFELQQEIIS